MSRQRASLPCVDREDRERAVRVRDRPLLVEAGAGTGKTTLLVDRIVYAVEEADLNIARLVAISFTEKAAAELRLRLRQGLQERLTVDDGTLPGRERIGRALRDLDRATLSTIHAFAASILREQPVPAQLDPRFRTLDELESARFFRTFWDRWVDEQLEQESTIVRLRPALVAGVRLEPDLYDLARDLELQRDVVHQLVVPPAVPDLEMRLRALRDAMLDCVRHAEEQCVDGHDSGLQKLRVLGTTMEALEHLDPTSWPAVFLGKLPLHLTAGRKEAWRPGEAARSKAWRKELRAELERVKRAIADDLLHGALGWLARFRAAYAAEKRRRGVLDFQDLLLEARGLVRDDPGVRRELASRIDMLCVDEFQDTDPLQAELVLFLAETGGPAGDWRDVRVGPQLFLVGDPKQSIYRFRRADLDVYEQCARIVVDSGGQRLTVRQNFRSRPAVLQWTNGVFEHLFAGPTNSATGPRHVALEAAHPPGPQPAVWILRPPQRADAPAPGDAWRRAEADALVGWLRRALDAGFPVREEEETRPMRLGDVALLFARTAGVEHYEEALRRAGLPFQQEGGRLFFRRQEVRDLLQALAAIDDPNDEMAIVAVLRSPFFGVTDEELWLHRAHHQSFNYVDTAGASPIKSQLDILASLHSERHRHGVAGTISALFDRTDARAVLAARAQGVQALANVEMLERLARQFETSQPAGLREFVRSLRDLDDEAPRVAEWSPQDEGTQRVRLLTVHVSKGLEFPCVLLAGLATGTNRRGATVVVDRLAGRVEAKLRPSELVTSLATAGHADVVSAEREREEAEERRLLYVAATRARDYLVVPAYQGKHAQGLLAALARVPGALGEAAEFAGFPPPVRHVDEAAGGTWCVLDEPLASPAASDIPGGARIDLTALWLRRARHGATRADRLARGGARPRVQVPSLGLDFEGRGPRRAWARLRELLATALEAVPAHGGEDALERAVLGLAGLHGASDLVPDLLTAIRHWRRSTIGERAARSTRVVYGARITAACGHWWAEAWVDCVLEGPEGRLLVEWVRASEPGHPLVQAPEGVTQGDEAAEDALLWKALALASAGSPVREAGRFFLEDARYVPVGDLRGKLETIRRRVESRT